jgi:hypothetical protein
MARVCPDLAKAVFAIAVAATKEFETKYPKPSRWITILRSPF